ncbi:MAG: haloacid dehalogenase type II [Actinomycetota bacterium]|nr:haloacid dehalogenase type II [Actinomycetota bacterium]
MARAIVFDVNETLLDLGALDGPFEEAFGDARWRREWFGQVLRLALVLTVTEAYRDFSVVAGAALEMTAQVAGISLGEDRRKEILAGVRRLPPHPEVPESLDRLRSAGLRLATLTNSPPATVEAQLENSGLRGFFERSLSVDEVGRFKPHREVYHHAVRELGVQPSGMRLVAAHNWDVTGAIRAGCAAVFVARPGMVLGPLDERPDIVGGDLSEVADRILAAEAG